jgi:hypothetical protein
VATLKGKVSGHEELQLPESQSSNLPSLILMEAARKQLERGDFFASFVCRTKTAVAL